MIYILMHLPQHLIKEDGAPFSKAELTSISAGLDALNKEQRQTYGGNNAETIAKHPANKMLIVSGPGTGKKSVSWTH